MPLMRWYVLRTLLHKELLRLLNNRGGMAMAAVMVVAAVLASAFGDSTFAMERNRGAPICVIDHWDDDAWIAHLRQNVPEQFTDRVRFRSLAQFKGTITYPPGAIGIQLRPPKAGESKYAVWIWHPDPNGEMAAPFEAWFWQESRRYFEGLAGLTPRTPRAVWTESHRDFRVRVLSQAEDAAVPEIDVRRSRLLTQEPDVRAGVAMFLVLMALCFICIFLMPSATAEERERGTLLAQALSPASSLEILGAKLMFYPTLAVALASLVAGICQPRAWSLPFFWLALCITALGTVGIGLTLSVLARTQRAASMGALSYMLAAGLLLLICRQNGLHYPAALMIEYHGPAMLLAALNDSVQPEHWGQLGVTWVLAVVWCGLATALFRRFGWQ
jgi:hypothetical protein